jgi:hypothetical protein
LIADDEWRAGVEWNCGVGRLEAAQVIYVTSFLNHSLNSELSLIDPRSSPLLDLSFT